MPDGTRKWKDVETAGVRRWMSREFQEDDGHLGYVQSKKNADGNWQVATPTDFLEMRHPTAKKSARHVAFVCEDDSKNVKLSEEQLAAMSGQYTYAELTNVSKEIENPFHKEQYLSDAEFETVFEMMKAEFIQLPLWKKNRAKKDVGLF